MEESNVKNFVGYEYTTVTAKSDLENMVVDGYVNFGWTPEGREVSGMKTVALSFKRNRKIRNKAELSRLQRDFDKHLKEIEALEASKTASAQIVAFTIGFVGTAALAGSMFAYLAGMLPLMVVLAVPGFMGWILPYFVYKGRLRKKAEAVTPAIEVQYDTIYEICEQANNLSVA